MAPRRFEVWDASEPREREAWLAAWRHWPAREVSAHPSYGALFADFGDRVLCASYATADGGGVLYPFICRDMSKFMVVHGLDPAIHDIISPYGYGGPYAWGLSDADLVGTDFWTQFDAWAKDQNIVSEFIRFDLAADSLLAYPGERVCRSLNLVRTLDLDENDMWMSFEHKVRKNVRKAERSGVTVRVDETGEFISEFMRLYEGTMDRRSANQGYYFPQTFFESIHRELRGQFAYFHALHDDAIVSTELVLVSAHSVYSFLGGTDSSAFGLRPNDLLKHEIIRWARSQGKRTFVLGGGASPGDGIERYKRSFAPGGGVDFFTGQRVLRPDLYRQLVNARKSQFIQMGRTWPDESTYFPAYRMPF